MDPLALAKLVAGAVFEPNRVLGDRILLDGGQTWRTRLRAQYLLDDGRSPRGFADTGLIARRWQAPNQVVLVFETVC